MKKIIALLIILCMSASITIPVHALTARPFITLKVNGNCITTDTQPYIEGDQTYVPIRFIGEALGAETQWMEEEQKVVLKFGEETFELFPGNSQIIINGAEEEIDSPVVIVNDRTMVPVRAVGEKLGFTVDWDPLTYTVLVYKEGAVVPSASIQNRSYTDEDIIWLSRIVNVEARGLSIDGKVAVANVVLNRKKSPQFPSTIYDVIFQVGYYAQFPPAHKDGFKESIPTTQSIVASKMALEGINNVETCLFFNNAPFSGKSDDLYTIIEGEYFYY